jgi:hypothetical protein
MTDEKKEEVHGETATVCRLCRGQDGHVNLAKAAIHHPNKRNAQGMNATDEFEAARQRARKYAYGKGGMTFEG